jgi:hypothetical protein
MRLGFIFLFLFIANSAVAGTIANGAWSPTNCGEQPSPPVIADQDVKSFNKSMDAIGDWQNKTKNFFECLVKEANADNAIIAESANRAQANNQKVVETLNATIDEAEKKLTKK